MGETGAPSRYSTVTSAELRAHNLVPLWEVASNLVTREPVAAFPPCHWDYDGIVRPFMLAATGENAERRVLLLANPHFSRPTTTGTLSAGIQLIQDREIAGAHRHSQSALRMVIEGEGAYTAVNGERMAMARGDLILTPGWSWHDHEKTADGPMIWLDGLDLPLVNHLGAPFYEEFSGAAPYPRSRPVGFSQGTFGHSLRPLGDAFGSVVDETLHAPQLHFPYREARAALQLMQKAGAPDPVHGYKLRYSNSVTGADVLPAIAAFIQLLPRAFLSRSHRRTDAAIFFVIEGAGTTRIGDVEIPWKQNDVFVVPNWSWHSHETTCEAVLFSFSDSALQKKLGLWRDEQRP